MRFIESKAKKRETVMATLVQAGLMKTTPGPTPAASATYPFRVNPDGETLSRNRHGWNNRK
jgi:hypothetical protein